MTRQDLNDILDGKATAVFYGAGSLYRECAEQLHQLIDNLTMLIVDQKFLNTNDVSINGIPCRGPEVLSGLLRSTLIVICTRNHLAIAEDLRDKGFYNIKYAQFELSSIRVKQVLDYPKSVNAVGSHKVAFGDRTALITGSTRGIGLEIAVALALRGVRVILHGRTGGSLKEGLGRFEERTSLKTDGVVADLSQLDGPEILCHHLLMKNIKVNILYNNAGISLPTNDGAADASENSFDQCMIVNFRAVVGLTSRLLPRMMESGYGRIVFLTSMARGQPDRIGYICSKAALTSYAYELVHVTDGTAVRVSTLDPGWVRSDMGGELATNDLGSVIPGALVGALSLPIENGIWVSAQDYSGLSDDQLIKKTYIDGFLK
jgi:short-subunit dehydrogenase